MSQLDKYNALKLNKTVKDISPTKEIDNKSEENSEISESDFFKKSRKKSENMDKRSIKSNNSINNDKGDYQGILNVHESHELTSNKLYAYKKFRMSKVELRDLIFYLEENQSIALNKQILFKAYIDMTTPKTNNLLIEEDKEKEESI